MKYVEVEIDIFDTILCLAFVEGRLFKEEI